MKRLTRKTKTQKAAELPGAPAVPGVEELPPDPDEKYPVPGSPGSHAAAELPVAGAGKVALNQLPIEWVEFSKVNPAPYNPRRDLRPGDPEYQSLEREMMELGFAGGMVWNKQTGNLVGGHQRLKILKAHGHTRAQMAVCDLPLAQEKVFNVALNKTGGSWDERALADLLAELRDLPGVDATLTGLSEEEIAAIADEGHRLVEQLVPPEEDDEGAGGGGTGGDGGDGDSGGVPIDASFQVIVLCKNEKQQQEVYNLLQGKKIKCRVSTLN